jgi:hypothetical protein
MQYGITHSFLPHSRTGDCDCRVPVKRSTLAHPNLSALNLIGTTKDTTFNGSYPASAITQAAESDLQRDRRCNAPPETCAAGGD